MGVFLRHLASLNFIFNLQFTITGLDTSSFSRIVISIGFLFNNTVKTLGSRQKKCLNWRVESLKVSKVSARVRTNRAVTTCW